MVADARSILPWIAIYLALPYSSSAADAVIAYNAVLG
jgi:hypothetical protein